MNKRKFLFAGLLSALAISSADAQVKDVSVTVSPFMEYNWWNKNINLSDGPFYGARLGFGFGQFFELRALAEKSMRLDATIEDKKIEGVDRDITRLGAEAKVNILGGYGLSPYITAGTGVQFFDYDPLEAKTFKKAADEAKKKEQQLYVTLGAGVKMNLSDRMVLSLEARNIRFNMDSDNPYLKPTKDEKSSKVGTWAAMASLDFYLGGNTTAEADRYGRAYHSLFSDGFVGPKFVVEPGMAWVNFNNKLHREDQWFLGGSAGVDFSSLIGLRGFYYQATKQANKLNFDFNKDLKMYGANIIARLNYPRGIVPYLSLGAGYLDDNNFIEDPTNKDKSIKQKNLFALAGAGVEIPVSRYMALYGTVNSMLMSDREKVGQISKPSHIMNSMMYTAGVRFNLGVPANAPAFEQNTNVTVNNQEINNLRSNKQRQEVKRARKGDKCGKCPNAPKMLTKKEFEEMVNRIVKKIKEEENASASISDTDMDVILAALNQQKVNKSNSSNQELISEIRTLVAKLNANTTATPNVTVVNPNAPAVVARPVPAVPNNAYAQDNNQETKDAQVAVTRVEDPEVATSSKTFDFLKMNRMALITGINFGESTLWNFGLRGYMQVSNTNFDFVPELFFGAGSKNGFGLSANLVYNINLNNSPVSPYVGLGLGFFNHGMDTNMGSNIILGTNINAFANGAFFVDYSARRGFENNQIAVGYRFVF